MLSPDLLRVLKSVDTPTVCNAIEVAQGRRGFKNFTRKTMLASDANAPAMVGYACTAQIAALEPPKESSDTIKKRRMDYYRAMAAAVKSGPTICVVEDVDDEKAVGAFWGEVNTTVHKGLGLVGTITNGLMRDLGDMANDYPVLAGGIGPSHMYVHIRSVSQPVKIYGMAVNQGDLLHADCHGALVIPDEVLPNLNYAVNKLLETERLILEPARQPDFNIDEFEKAWAAFEAART